MVGQKLTLKLLRWSSLCVLLMGVLEVALAGPGSYSGTRSGLDLTDVDMMFIGAHPDDEGGIMATFARYEEQGYRAAVLTITDGQGGGNATGPELHQALGLIRRAEERQALGVLGIMPYFLGYTDFFYTLSAELTAKKWGPEVLCDVVRQIRVRRPEVLVTMWPGPGTHGNHQMAARLTTIAFEKAADPKFCPEQITHEFLKPFQPLKLYYYPPSKSAATVSIPTSGFSRPNYMPYADLKALAESKYRSQGFDQFFSIPVKNPSPERFMLVKSLVPVNEPETGLLDGALRPAGYSPVGIQLRVDTANYAVGVGGKLKATVTFANHTKEALRNVTLSLNGPKGWSATAAGDTTYGSVEPGQQVQASFEVTPSDTAEVDRNARLTATYQASMQGQGISGRNYTWAKAAAPVEVAFKPLYDIADFRKFIEKTRTQWVAPSLPTRLPLTIGQATPVAVEITNSSASSAQGKLEFNLPQGITASGDLSFQVPANSTREKTVDLKVDPSVLPAGQHSTAVPGTVKTTVSGYTSSDKANIYALPTLTIPKVSTPPTIDGDLSDMMSLPAHSFSYKDLWSGKASGPADTGATFYVGYDDKALYIGVHVIDQTVVCNIKSNDIRAHWRTDSVEVTIDPSGKSQDTSTTFKTGIFPCTTAGFKARAERDADADQGVIEKTAPGMKVASKKTADGYNLGMSIPWDDMPGKPTTTAGKTIGFNVLVYDGDQADALPGANIGQSRAGWASVIGAQQAVPYVWPKVTLGE